MALGRQAISARVVAQLSAIAMTTAKWREKAGWLAGWTWVGSIGDEWREREREKLTRSKGSMDSGCSSDHQIGWRSGMGCEIN
jgi:hypothetical protein